MTMTTRLTQACTAALMSLALASAAQAARLDVLSASVIGSSSAQVSADAGSLSFDGTLADLSGVGYAFGFDGGAQTAALGGGSVSHDWSRLLSVDGSVQPGRLDFQASSSSNWAIAEVGTLQQVSESSSATVLAQLQVVGEGEALGSAVRVDITGTLQSVFATDLADALEGGLFDLVVRNSMSTVIASYSAGPSAVLQPFALSFNSVVGEELEFSLSQAAFPGGLTSEVIGAGQSRFMQSSALIDGSMTVTAVPEAQSWALALSGLVMVGALGRAARRRTA